MDRSTLALPGDQDELIAAVAAANPRTIVVLNTGGPVLMPWLRDVEAVLQAWYPGQAYGEALAAVLFGDADPGGRLPMTFPASDEQGPAPPTRPERYPGVAARSATTRASSSATAGTTPPASGRCSRSGTASPTPPSSCGRRAARATGSRRR